MARWVKVAKPDDTNSIPRTHEKNQLPKVVLWPPNIYLSINVPKYTHTHTTPYHITP